MRGGAETPRQEKATDKEKAQTRRGAQTVRRQGEGPKRYAGKGGSQKKKESHVIGSPFGFRIGRDQYCPSFLRTTRTVACVACRMKTCGPRA